MDPQQPANDRCEPLYEEISFCGCGHYAVAIQVLLGRARLVCMTCHTDRTEAFQSYAPKR